MNPKEVRTKEVFFFVAFRLAPKMGIRETQFCRSNVGGQMQPCCLAKRPLPVIRVQIVSDLQVDGIIEIFPQREQATVEHPAGGIGSKRAKCDQRAGGRPDQRVSMTQVPTSDRRQEFPQTERGYFGEVDVCVQPLQLEGIVACTECALFLGNSQILKLQLREKAHSCAGIPRQE